MIEFKKQLDSERLKPVWKLLLNGELLPETNVNIVRSREDSRDYFHIFSNSLDESRKLFNNRIFDFPPLEYITLVIEVEGNEMINRISISPAYPYDAEGKLDILEFSSNKDFSFEISTVIDPNLNEWVRDFTFREYVWEFENILLNNKVLESQVFSGEPNDYRFVVKWEANFGEDLIIIEVDKFLNQIKSIHYEVLNKLKDNNKRYIFTQLTFPEELKISCEQYLLYFAQFLKDLGINSTSSLKEEAGKVLFSVTPTDDVEALDKIREALAIYLNLPSSPVVYDESFAAMRLKQQVENLQHSQRMKEMEIRSAQYALNLAQQNIENQGKLIIHQNSTIENQNKIIEKITSKSVMIDSLENKEEFEEVCEGLKVGKSKFLTEQIGVHLNPITFAKTIGKRFLGNEDERKSILGLDEETTIEDN